MQHARVGVRLEGFLRENQSPRVRQDAKRQKRVRDQSPTPEIVDLERESNVLTSVPQAPAPATQAMPVREGTQNAARQSADPPGTVLRNGSLATTTVGPNGTQVLRKPGPTTSGLNAANPATSGAAPPITTRVLRDGSRVATYIAEDGTPTLRQNGMGQENEEPRVSEDDVTTDEAGDKINDPKKEKEKRN